MIRSTVENKAPASGELHSLQPVPEPRWWRWAEVGAQGNEAVPGRDDQCPNEISCDEHTSSILFYFILIESLGNASCFINVLLFSDQSTIPENLINK